MERIKLLVLGIFSMGSFNGCSFGDLEEVLDKSGKITSTLQRHCDCDEISVMNYSVHNLTTTATYKLVGCTFSDIDSEALRIKQLLKDSIPGFCEIKEFNLVFINKGNERIKKFARCREQ